MMCWTLSFGGLVAVRMPKLCCYVLSQFRRQVIPRTLACCACPIRGCCLPCLKGHPPRRAVTSVSLPTA